jgi:hypothetical protein
MREFRKIAIGADAVARAIAYAIEQPADVDVSEIIVRPTASILSAEPVPWPQEVLRFGAGERLTGFINCLCCRGGASTDHRVRAPLAPGIPHLVAFLLSLRPRQHTVFPLLTT